MSATGPVGHAVSRRVRHPGLRTGLLLVLPLLLFLVVNFLVPISVTLLRGVQDHELPGAWPRTAAALRAWDGVGLPPEALVATFVEELATAKAAGRISEVANRLNYDVTGFRTLLARTAEALPLAVAGPRLDALAALDPRWGEQQTWIVLKHAAGPFTSFYLLAAFDRRLDAYDHVTHVPEDRAVFVDVLLRTFEISGVVTLLCLMLGYPVAYWLASLPERLANPLLILVLLPFWTSVLVRTTAWIVLLQTNGVVNDTLRFLQLVEQPLQLIYNRTGVNVAMTHVLLPYMILPLYAVMKNIPQAPLRAALSLGAAPSRVFWRVYAPQTLPGTAAGGLIVFVLALGYYITPSLVGGARDQMISYFIAFYTNQSLNWGMAAALSVVLLVPVLLLMQLYGRIGTGRRMLWR
jgi:putative spermidine/putrescine transport system permease protein